MAVQFAYRLALIAFAAATLRGALAGTDFEGTLETALAAGVVFFVLGLACGELARRLVEEQVEAEFERMMAASESQPSGSPAASQQRNSDRDA